MTPKKQAKVMIDKLSNSLNVFYKPKDNDAIGLSIECCDMILDAILNLPHDTDNLTHRVYWLDVKATLENMQSKLINP